MKRPLRVRAIQAGEGQAPCDLASLVDIAFLLLAFFVLTTTLTPREADLGMRFSPLPSASTPAQNTVIPDHCAIKVDSDGAVWCDGLLASRKGSESDLKPLRDRLSELQAANRLGNPEMAFTISLSAADDVKGQRLIDVLNCLAEIDGLKVRLEGFLN